MKLSQFKKLIQEAVREVIRDEIRDVLREELVDFGKVLTENVKPTEATKKPFNYKEFLYPETKQVVTENTRKKQSITLTNDPVKNMLLEIANELDPSEARQIAEIGPFTTNNSMASPMMHSMGDPDVNPSAMMDEELQGMKMPDMPNLGTLLGK